MASPFFSIIIPVYNSSKIITFVLNSIEKQTYRNFELIICDDFSKDNTVKLVQEWLKGKSFKHQLIISKKNNGAAYALNQCIIKSKGSHIVFGAHDNIFHCRRLEIIQKTIAKNPLFKFISHDAYTGSLTKFKKRQAHIQTGAVKFLAANISNLLLFRSSLFLFDTFVIHSSLIKNYSKYIKYSPVEDLALALNVFQSHLINVHHISKPLMFKVLHPSSQTFTNSIAIKNSAIRLFNDNSRHSIISLSSAESVCQISFVRNNDFIALFRLLIRNPVIFLLAFLVNLLRLSYKLINSRYVNLPRNFFK